jgi:hypothetical protein
MAHLLSDLFHLLPQGTFLLLQLVDPQVTVCEHRKQQWHRAKLGKRKSKGRLPALARFLTLQIIDKVKVLGGQLLVLLFKKEEERG